MLLYCTTSGESTASSSLDCTVLLWEKGVVPISQPAPIHQGPSSVPVSSPRKEPGTGEERGSEGGHVTALRSDLGRRLAPLPKASPTHREWPVAEDATEGSGHRQELD